jgi:hypothetical protein
MELWSKNIFVFITHLLWGPVSLLSSWNWGTKLPEREADNLPLRSAYTMGKLFLLGHIL